MHADKQTLLWGWGPIKSDLISPPPQTQQYCTIKLLHSSCGTYNLLSSSRATVLTHVRTHIHKHVLLTPVAPPTPPHRCASWSSTSLNNTPALPLWPSVAKCSPIAPLNPALLLRVTEWITQLRLKKYIYKEASRAHPIQRLKLKLYVAC